MSGSFLLETLSAARDLGRMHEIASILVRHGLGDIVRRLGIVSALEKAGKALHVPHPTAGPKRTPEQRARMALEELGPTFVKVGQILAGRRDLLPPEWTAELAGLRESVPEVPFEEIREQLVEDLGAPPEEVFAEFDREPLAAASIAQVYRARLEGGSPVVLKVRRPGIDDVVDADLRLLARVAELAGEELPELRRFRPSLLVRQLHRSLRRELDMRVEARNLKRMRELMIDQPGITVPRVHERFTTERLCVMEWLGGPSIGEWLAGDVDGVRLDRGEAARIGADAVLEMVFVHGFFHADPHPGNVIVVSDEDRRGLGLIDFGMVGSLSEARRMEFLELLGAFASRDDEAVVDVLLGWSDDGRAEPRTLLADVSAFLDMYADLPIGDVDAGEVLGEIATILRNNDLFLPDEVALLLKVFVTLDGLGKELDPEFVMASRVAPFAERALGDHFSPSAVLRRGRRQLTRLVSRIPRTVERAMDHARRGKVGIDIEVRNLEHFGDRVARSANRVSISLVTAALIVGTSIATTIPTGPQILGMPALAFVGFLSSSLAGVWLVLSMLRARR